MPIPTRATLKSYFETGDVPTQDQFAEMIDAMYDMAEQAIDAAEAAEAAVDALVPKVARCYGMVELTYTVIGDVKSYTALKEKDCTIGVTFGAVTSLGGGVYHGDVTLTITPDTNFDDDDFAVLHNIESIESTPPTSALVTTRAVGSCVLAFNIRWSGSPLTRVFEFAIFD